MVRWMLVNMNRGELDGHRILKDSTYDVLWKPAVDVSKDQRIGISWFLMDHKGQQVAMHNGGDDGFLTMLAFMPARKTGVVVMVNTDHAPMFGIGKRALLVALGEG